MLPGLPPATSSMTVSCVVTGGDQYGNNILDAAEAQIFASNTSILATLANMTALAVSHLVLPILAVPLFSVYLPARLCASILLGLCVSI